MNNKQGFDLSSLSKRFRKNSGSHKSGPYTNRNLFCEKVLDQK